MFRIFADNIVMTSNKKQYTKKRYYISGNDLNNDIFNIYKPFIEIRKEMESKQLWKDYRSCLVKNKFYVGIETIDEVISLKEEEFFVKRLQKLVDNNRYKYPTKQDRDGLVKFFFWYRYLWKNNPDKDSHTLCAGFRSDVDPPPKFLRKILCKILYENNTLDFKPDIIAFNAYLKNKKHPGIGLHKDINFDSDIVSLSFNSNSRLSFKTSVNGGHGHGFGWFALPLIQRSLCILKC